MSFEITTEEDDAPHRGLKGDVGGLGELREDLVFLLPDGPAYFPREQATDLRIEERIAEYRQALRRRTVCERCLYANAQSSRFCAECGRALAAEE